MLFDIELLTETTVNITCTNVTENNGIWTEEEYSIKIDGSSWTRIGNKIIVEYPDNEFPAFRKVVYMKN